MFSLKCCGGPSTILNHHILSALRSDLKPSPSYCSLPVPQSLLKLYSTFPMPVIITFSTSGPQNATNACKIEFVSGEVLVSTHPSLNSSSPHLSIRHLPAKLAFASDCVEVVGLLLVSAGSSIALTSRKWYRIMRSMAAEPRKIARR